MDTLENITDEEIFYGDDGNLYKKVTKEVYISRKTYLRGKISGKYRGSLYESMEEQYNTVLYEFEIYEANVTVGNTTDFRKNIPFKYLEEFTHISEKHDFNTIKFPKEKLPQELPVVLKSYGKSFGVNILEPNLYEFEPIRKMHQTDGDEIFGSFRGLISGFILDYEKEISEEIWGPFEEENVEKQPIAVASKSVCISSGISTGRIEKKRNYVKKEYYCRNHKHTIWGEWQRVPSAAPKIQSSIEAGLGCAGVLLGTIFILAVLPNAAILLPFILIPLLIEFIRPLLNWLFRIAAVVVMIVLGISIFNIVTKRSAQNYVPEVRVADQPKERQKRVIKVLDQEKGVKDTIYTQFRSWNDYDGNIYEGYYTFTKSNLNRAIANKKNLNVNTVVNREYDYMLHKLKETDKNNLKGLYKMFDSIQSAQNLNRIKFAEVIVSFVQDIPYSLVLPGDCSPAHYSDDFIRSYLLQPNAVCDGYQKFGINTPLEFLAKLKGDCDTRTLLLYTVLSYYEYDVVLLSSEYYKHSIIGINLPYTGAQYYATGTRYVCWETTAPGSKPGVLPLEINNMNYWRISLKSK